jgi:hypothetical protein
MTNPWKLKENDKLKIVLIKIAGMPLEFQM